MLMVLLYGAGPNKYMYIRLGGISYIYRRSICTAWRPHLYNFTRLSLKIGMLIMKKKKYTRTMHYIKITKQVTHTWRWSNVVNVKSENSTNDRSGQRPPMVGSTYMVDFFCLLILTDTIIIIIIIFTIYIPHTGRRSGDG